MDDTQLVALLERAYPANSTANFDDVRRRAKRRERRARRVLVVGVCLGVVGIVLALAAQLSSGAGRVRVRAIVPPSQSESTTTGVSNFPRLAKAFVRTTVDGVAIGAFSTAAAPQGAPVPQGSLVVELATVGGLVSSTEPISPTLPPGQVVAALEPVQWSTGPDTSDAVVVRTGPAVGTVRLALSDGTTDEMKPVNGWAVLAGKSLARTGRINALAASGAPLASSSITFVSQGKPLPALFVRRTSEGILIRGAITAGFAAPNVSNRGSAHRLEGVLSCPRTKPASVFVMPQDVVGTDEGTPFTVVPVQVAPTVATVVVRFTDGFTDSMTPVGGVAMLAHEGTVDSYTVQALNASGTVLASMSVNYQTTAPILACPA